jgi:hypothetical protein
VLFVGPDNLLSLSFAVLFMEFSGYMKKYYTSIITSNEPLKADNMNLARLNLGSSKKKPAPAMLESIYICVIAKIEADKSAANVAGDTPITDLNL